MPPGYQHVAADMRRRIDAGEWPPGTQLPSWRDLSGQYAVGLGVIRLAIERLRADELVEGRARSRLQVAYRPAVRTLVRPDARWPHGRGDTEMSTVRADADLARRLEVAERAPLHRERVELLDPDGRPAMVQTTWRRGSVARPHVSHQLHVTGGTLDRAAATLLGLGVGMVVLVIERTRYDERGLPVETADLVLPADRWRIKM
ncbi:GntR family transcriptional regulator [Streptomyces sp. NPDC088354]|uniref:GntR family transcriptional regulator n=1 Tax=Streptomyces sp. NPDC088354 TaxID=3365856 RepID=UPI003802F0DD